MGFPGTCRVVPTDDYAITLPGLDTAPPSGAIEALGVRQFEPDEKRSGEPVRARAGRSGGRFTLGKSAVQQGDEEECPEPAGGVRPIERRRHFHQVHGPNRIVPSKDLHNGQCFGRV